jgi:predicted membrane-bound spermidine synthase
MIGFAMHTRSMLLAYALFFCSGSLGLGYQLVWVHKATLIVGASQLALSTVLTSFFLGLAFGSLVVGLFLKSGRRSPLLVYGLFEAGIGLFALAFPELFAWVETVYGFLYEYAADSTTALLLLRFTLLFLLFLPPTFLMGGTLPLLLDGLIERDRTIGSQTSLLYGLNILGAVAGVLATSYWAIPAVGITATSRLGGVANLAIGAVAVLAFRRLRPLHADGVRRASAPRLPFAFIALSIASGFAAIGYQVAWARYFGLFNNANVYFTALLLAVYLLALSVGSLVLAIILRGRLHPLRVMGFVQPIVSLLVATGLEAWRLVEFGYERVGWGVPGDVVPTWAFWSETADAVFFAPLARVALVVFLPAVLMGTGLPAIIAAATRHSGEIRANSGRLVFWNTLGASAGGFATGYLLLPGVGLSGTLFTMAIISIGLGIGAEACHRRADPTARSSPARGWLRPGVLIGAVALAYSLDFFIRVDVTERTLKQFAIKGLLQNAEIMGIAEGPVTTAYVFKNNGAVHIAAGNVPLAVAPSRTHSGQSIQGHFPAILRPAPEPPVRGLGIALGSGQTVGALLLYPMEHVDVVDISPEIVGLSLEHFADRNHGLATDERVRLHIDDGRHFVARAEADFYDVVSLEPPPPTYEGVYRLYSHEFYVAVERVLRDRGVLAQWLPLYLVTPNETRALLRTQADVFPYTFVVKVGNADFIILSIKGDKPPRFSIGQIAERVETFRRERLIEGARWNKRSEHEIASLEGVLSAILTGPDDLVRIREAPILTEDDQSLSYSSGDRHLLRRYKTAGTLILRRISFAEIPITPFAELQKYFEEPLPLEVLEEERARALSNFHVALPAEARAARENWELAREPAQRARAALVLAVQHDRVLRKRDALAWIAKAIEADPHSDNSRQRAAVRRIARNQIPTYAEVIREWLDSIPEDARGSALAQAVGIELDDHDRRIEERRAEYLFE